MTANFFKDPTAFRQWLETHHDSEDELWVGYYKKGTGIPSITWPESVDEALCFGWIDGLRKTIDGDRYRIRFTPRRPRSNWSAVNIGRVAELKKLGKMKPAGLEAFERRKSIPAGYTYEKKPARLSADYEAAIKSDVKAWEYFNQLAPSYKRHSVHWVMSAKKEATRQRRLKVLIESSRKGCKIPAIT